MRERARLLNGQRLLLLIALFLQTLRLFPGSIISLSWKDASESFLYLTLAALVVVWVCTPKEVAARAAIAKAKGE